MEITPTKLQDVFTIKPSVHQDSRGYFSETFRQDLLSDALGYTPNFVQDNQSQSTFGVLRGLHFQKPPFAQSKLVQVIVGAVLDVAVDLRQSSPTYGQHIKVELSAENHMQLFIPQGFAHGFVVLSDKAVFSYKVDNYYQPSHDSGILFSDSKLNIDWQLPADQLLISEKDQKLPPFSPSHNYFE